MDNQLDTVLRLKAAGESNRAIAAEIGVDEATIRRWLKKVEELEVPEFDATFVKGIELPKPLTHYGPAMVSADWHFPLFKPELGNDLLRTAEQNNIKTLVVAGDLFNMDALSRFEPKQEEADLWNEIQVTKGAIEVMLKVFDRILYIRGNHDERLIKALGYKLQFKQSIELLFGALGVELLDRITFSNQDHLWVKPYPSAPSNLSWRICHPSSGYTQVPLSKARLLADKYDANIIAAHSHHFALGWDRSGKKIVAEAGGLFDKEKTGYLSDTTSYPVWVPGYLWLDYVDKPFTATKPARLGINAPSKLWVPGGTTSGL